MRDPVAMVGAANAVFKGGGAKGIAYAGALRACEEAGVEFRAVAGSSAGAITATLVACGYSAHKSAALLPDALGSIDAMGGSIFALHRSSLLSGRRLEMWIAARVADRIAPGWEASGDGGRPPACTFADIERVTGVQLFVVTMDLATRQPIVFSPALSPDVPVAPAVVASSAIPVAFPPSRMAIGHDVRRLVDGGAWSNYPAFVFLDDDFRAYHRLAPTELPTIGFILDDRPADEPVDPNRLRPVDGPRFASDRGSVAREFGAFGAAVSSPMFRWAVVLAPILFVLLSMSFFRTEAMNGFPILGHTPEVFQDVVVQVLMATVAIVGVLALVVSLIYLRFGRDIADPGLVGASAAMGVGPSVPYWIRPTSGHAAGRHLPVRIPVPAELTTLQFRPAGELVNETLAAGYEAARAVLVSEASAGAGSGPPTVVVAADRVGVAGWLRRLWELDRSTVVAVLGPNGSRSRWRTVTVAVLGVLLFVTVGPLLLVLRLYSMGLSAVLRRASSSVSAWLLIVAFSATGASLLSLNAVERFAAGEVYGPFGILLVAGFLVLVLAWSLTARRTGRSGTPYRWLGRRTSSTLAMVGLGALAAGISMLTVAPDEDSVIAISKMDTTVAIVGAVRPIGDEVVIELRFPAAGDELAASVLGSEQPRVDVLTDTELSRLGRDTAERSITRCGGARAADPRCLAFRSVSTELRPDDVHVVRHDVERGKALLDQNVWADDDWIGATARLGIGVALLVVAFQCWMAWRWRRQHAALERSDPEPWASPVGAPVA